MISLEIFLLGLLIISTITGLTTEGVKKILAEHNVTYRANTLAGLVALIIAAFVGLGYIFSMNIDFTAQIIVCFIAEVFMSWLCAMVGYDKVIQAISQFKTTNKE